MKSISLRTLIATIALTVAVVTTVAVPAGYWLIGQANLSRDLDLKARIIAGRVARYIYQHGELWQYQRLRITELIEFNEADDDGFYRRVVAGADRTVADAGRKGDNPVVTRKTLIVVSGETVGQVEAEASLHTLLRETAIVALISFVLGFGAFLALRVFPLRVLDRTIEELKTANRAIKEANVRLHDQYEELQQRDQELQTQNARFDAALTNMEQGLCMFDREQRLVVANRRFVEISALPPGRVKVGMSLRELVEAAAAAGYYPGQQADDALAEFNRIWSGGKTVVAIREWAGRTLSAVYMPIADGGWVATYEDITERRQAEAKIFHLARHDGVTDLPNRLSFREQMAKTLENIARDQHLAVFCLDLDHFKGINDTLGHPVGDRLLKLVAERVRKCLRDADLVARLGGDEFAILQRGGAQPQASTTLAQRLVETISAPYQIDGHHVVIGTSIGISIAPTDATDPDLLLQHADLALYRAKADGRGTYRYFESAMDARMRARRTLELDLRRALANQELTVFYQPLVNVATEQITGFEALVRWNHPTRGVVPPAEFIPLAEETGLVLPLDEWVLRQACSDAANWPDHVHVAVNLSAAQFRNHGLTSLIVSALAASQLRPNRLEIEVTESVLLQENEVTLATLNQLRLLGVRISMDDFGTGYSSLSYLRSFPFDKIKIDRSFISELSDKPDSLAIIRAVTGLGRSLGMTTTAEGVETREQFERLKLEGCDEIQGYLFGRPQPLAEIEQFFSKQCPLAEAVA
jgi:diguanylate cyclase (GGDEF)-like protein